ncbi:hypothetical protein H0H81_004565, partial [Sphagnurus paluster]
MEPRDVEYSQQGPTELRILAPRTYEFNLSHPQAIPLMCVYIEAIQRITGVLTAFTRPPYGDYNDLVIEVANAHGQTLVNWDFDSGDTAGKSPEKSKQLYKELADRHPSTILALNHDVKQGTA